jgi:rod shape-determining protein MreB
MAYIPGQSIHPESAIDGGLRVGRFSLLAGLRSAFADPDLAIDLGTANTRMCVMGKGLVADERSVIRVGDSAVSPMRAGVIEDVDAAAMLLAPLFRRARRLGLVRPRVLACAPTDACEDERAALVEAASRAGAASVRIAPEPLAAAIGAGLDVSSPYAQMLVDIGDGVTDIAVIASGSVICSSAIRTACSDLHEALRSAVAESHGAMLYLDEAERLTRTVGVVKGEPPPARLPASGTDRRTGRKTRVVVTSHEVVEAIDPIVAAIVEAVGKAVADLPATTSCEVIESGICLTGGGARLPGLAERLRAGTCLDVTPARDPLRAVINGAQQMLSVGGLTGLWAS